MARGRATLEWDQTSLLWSLTRNLNRDPKETPKPFLPSDVHPYRTAEDYQPKDEARAKVIDTIKRTCQIRRLNNGSIRNISRQGVSPTPD